MNIDLLMRITQGGFMKKKFLTLCFAFMMIVPAIFLLSACGGGKETKKDRTNTAEIVDIYIDSFGGVFAEVVGFEHTDYEMIGNSGLDAYSLEFSINDGDWFVSNISIDIYNKNGKGIYQLAYANYTYENNVIESYNVSMTGQSIEPGEATVSVRIPESDKYNASVGSEPEAFVFKANIQNDLSEKIDVFVADIIGENIAISSAENNRFVLYKDSVNPYILHVGKYSSKQKVESDMYDLSISELTAEEQAEFDALNLEFKVVNYNEKYLMKNSSDSEGETYTSIDAMSIENDENDAIYTTEGWSDQLIMSENNVWEYNSSSTQTVKEIVILVRQKADENTIQSPAMSITYLVSYEYIETV